MMLEFNGYSHKENNNEGFQQAKNRTNICSIVSTASKICKEIYVLP